MKVVILAGGLGTRISEESHLRPKPMIEIGDRPILWHIMKIYSHYGYNEFVICAGYKHHVIKEFFSDYFLNTSDITFDLQSNKIQVHGVYSEPWKVTVVNTGLNTMTGGRVKRIADYVGNERFMLTYGDAVADINIAELVKFHESHGKIATLTAIQPGSRFGSLDIDSSNIIRQFKEKLKEDGGWINAGFMVLEPEIFRFIDGDATVLEREPLMRVAEKANLAAFHHKGFWQCMDTLREKELLERLLMEGEAPWTVWNVNGDEK